jgi:hypothetical protein
MKYYIMLASVLLLSTNLLAAEGQQPTKDVQQRNGNKSINDCSRNQGHLCDEQTKNQSGRSQPSKKRACSADARKYYRQCLAKNNGTNCMKRWKQHCD